MKKKKIILLITCNLIIYQMNEINIARNLNKKNNNIRLVSLNGISKLEISPLIIKPQIKLS